MLCWIPFLVAFFVYLPTLSYEFVGDDQIHIVDNPLVSSGGSIKEILFQGLYPGTLYRPMLIASYRLTFDLFGGDPIWYHAGNILLHAVICVLVVLVLRRVFSFREALLAGILFAVQPMHVEAVANVSGRSELLAHLFGLILLVVATARGSRLKRGVLASAGFFLVFALALLTFLSKESGLVYIPLLCLIFWYQYDGKVSSVLRGEWLALCAACLAAGSALWLRFLAIGSVVTPLDSTAFYDNPLIKEAPLDRTLNGFILLGKYLYLSFVPGTLVRDYSFSQQQVFHTVFDAEVVVYLTLTFVFVLLACQGIKRREKAGFCALFFFVAFLITANLLIPIGTIFAERLAYLPSLGVAGMLSLYLSVLKTERVRMAFFALLCTAFTAQTIGFSQFWKSSSTLYRRQAETSPKSVKALVNYSVVLRNTGNEKEARAAIARAVSIAPNYAEADFALASLELQYGNNRAAQEALLSAVAKNPAMLPALNMLGRLFFNSGKLAQAEIYFRRALKADKANVEALLGAFALHLKRGNLKAASRVHLALKRLVPDNAEFMKLEKVFKQIQQKLSKPAKMQTAGLSTTPALHR
jgi:tetratricopeptide (TPR) repeat protein